ncbi:glycosyltransferase family 61 protein [Candidatus Dependentiae bacterium]|nr:glycosyltransferase family 61 protein [Candidatus Dependentiae bacterium]
MKKNYFLIGSLFISSYFFPFYKLISIADLLKDQKVTYQKVEEQKSFEFERPFLSLGDLIQPYRGAWQETFVLIIPHGRVHSTNGWVTIDNCCIKELFWCGVIGHIKHIPQASEEKLQKISGRVVVLAQPASGNYYHYMYEILGRLLLIEQQGIEYDWLYVPFHKPFMKELLQLWGVDMTKVIQPSGIGYYIQADELIVPSMIINTCFEREPDFGGYLRPDVVEKIKDRLIKAADHYDTVQNYAKKIFISRKDGKRNVPNEDEVFELFKEKGFVRYELGKMPVVEQIKLFQNAEVVVAIHGAGCFNMIFCKSGTKFIELFQALRDATFSFLAPSIGIDYSVVQTVDFITKPGLDAHLSTPMPLFIIKEVVKNL